MIGITISATTELFSNGCRQHVIMYYDFLEYLKYDVVFVTHTKKISSYTHNGKDYKFIYEKNSACLKTLLVIGQSLTPEIAQRIRKKGVRIVYVMLGKKFSMHVGSMLFGGPCDSHVPTYYDEVWISPHFKKEIEYYQCYYRTQNVYIQPYFWIPKFVPEYKSPENYNQLHIAICEPNLSWLKHCLIPICIVEKAHSIVEKCMVFNTQKLRSNKFFKQFLSSCMIQKDKIISCENRYALGTILKYCNVFITNTYGCCLNFLHFELLHLGVPLVHNSEPLKDAGFYYEKNNISQAVEHLRRIKKSFDKVKYKKRNQHVLQKYSIHNKYYHKWFKKRFKQILDR